MSLISKHKKIFIILLITIIFFGSWLFDMGRAAQYKLEVVDMPAETVMGDTLSIKMRIIKHGVPQQGHLLAAMVVDGKGSFLAYRIESDENGEAEFSYSTLKETKYNPVRDIYVKIYDESNSVLIEVNVYADITIHMISANG